jgi:HD-GYP domain-containing protein (c-di-GMP phosphodiesterase class II)
MLVLGGLVAGPALAITGFIMGAKASANLDRAKSNYADATKIKAELEVGGQLCEGIRKRSNMFERLLVRLDALFLRSIYKLEEIIDITGQDYRQYSEEERKSVALSASLAKAIKTLIDTAILTEDGKLTDESGETAKKIELKVRDWEKSNT